MAQMNKHNIDEENAEKEKKKNERYNLYGFIPKQAM